MTHNQVAYWDSVWNNQNAKVRNSISQQEADTTKWRAEREEYWTHRNANFNEGLFGFELAKTFMGMMAGAAAGGIL